MKVKIIRPTIAQKRQVFPGDVLDVSKDEAVQLIGANKAVPVKETAAETTDAPAANVETTELPAANTETFAPVVKRGRSKKASEGHDQ